jgi:hypothetical protein
MGRASRRKRGRPKEWHPDPEIVRTLTGWAAANPDSFRVITRRGPRWPAVDEVAVYIAVGADHAAEMADVPMVTSVRVSSAISAGLMPRAEAEKLAEALGFEPPFDLVD